MVVEIKQFPERRVAAVRHVGPYHLIGQAFAKLGQIAGPAGLFGRPGAEMVGLYHDPTGSVPADRLRSDAGVVLPPGVPVPAGLTEERVGAGTFACTVHQGGYETLGATWGALLSQWLPASGRRLGSGPSLEIYRNTMMDTPNPADLRTEICIPLEDA